MLYPPVVCLLRLRPTAAFLSLLGLASAPRLEFPSSLGLTWRNRVYVNDAVEFVRRMTDAGPLHLGLLGSEFSSDAVSYNAVVVPVLFVVILGYVQNGGLMVLDVVWYCRRGSFIPQLLKAILT
jgi:hypothetical protein